MEHMRRTFLPAVLSLLALSAPALAQVPAPFPRPGQTPGGRTQPPVAPPQQAPAQPSPDTGVPTEATLGVPLYPSAQFIESYDAGRGQRYYLFGAETDFLQIVTFYKSLLKQKGELLFDEPPIHMFEIGRFREESMVFTPSVTVKDYTWGGSEGYLNPKLGASPARFKTIIQVVPVPPGAAK
jgi:hypothetical protein